MTKIIIGTTPNPKKRAEQKNKPISVSKWSNCMAYQINPTTNDITLVRGDYFPCIITMSKNGEPFTPENGTLRFAVKRRYTDSDERILILKQIPLDTCLLELESEDTKNMSFGSYVYDIEYQDVYGRPDTFIRAKFTLAEEVY